MRKIVFVLLASLILVLPAHARPNPPLVRDFQPIDAWQPRGPGMQTWTLTLGGKRRALRLEDNRELLDRVPAATRAAFVRHGDRFLRGRIDGVAGSWVRLNRIDGALSGAVFDGNELWLIDRAGALGVGGARAPDAEQTIAYRFSDLKTDLLFDHGGVEAASPTAKAQAPLAYEEFAAHLAEIFALQGQAAVALPITIVSDTQFSARNPGNETAVVAGRINFIDGIYSAQVGVGITLWHHEILGSNGTLTATAADGLLGQFETYMNTGAGASIPFRGLAHLFTGRDMDGSTVGIAFLSPSDTFTVLCRRDGGLGVDQDLNPATTSALVLAHEVGHNFNARHDDSSEFCPGLATAEFGIMNSSINGSQTFSSCSLPKMSNALSLISGQSNCLVEISPIIFEDGFEAVP